LYLALERRSCLDVKAIALIVKTKSEVEINAYLQWLRQAETDRQLFERQTKNISHIDIPAAIEIGSECEAVLDKAAAALSAFQENFDLAAGQRNQGVWFVDHQTASELDKAADEAELSNDLPDIDSGESQPLADSSRFFYTSTFLKLSESFYMNQGSGETWYELGEPDERPAMTMEALTQFYEIVVSYLRRLIQSIIFIAKSRVRSTSAISHSTLQTVRQEDVVAALDILNSNNHLWDYWIHMARRNKLLVVPKNSVKHFDPDAVMDFDRVEEILSERRRSRSLSAMSELSNEAAQSDDSLSEPGDRDEDDALPESMEEDASEPEMEPGDDYSDEEGMVDGEGGEDMSLSSGDESESHHAESSSAVPRPSSNRKRGLAIEDETNDYMEQLDQMARVQEESRLFQLLGLEPEKSVKEEQMETPHKRPRVMRKTVAETKRWQVGAYQSQWELDRDPVQVSISQIPASEHNEASMK